MLMFSFEKERLYDVIDNLRNRITLLETKIDNLQNKHRYGIKLDGTPRAKPGRKPSK